MKIKIAVFLSVLPVFLFFSGKSSFADFPPYGEYKNTVALKQSVFFELSKSGLTADAVSALKEIAVLLRLYGKNVLVIEGHADNTGEEAYNKKLSYDRAQAVFEFFVENGIEPFRMKIVYYGDQKPLNSNFTEADRAENRRAEIIVFKAD